MKAELKNLIDSMNDQFNRILGYVEQVDKKVEQIDKKVEQVDKKTADVPVVLARLEANDARMALAEANMRDHEQRVSKLEATR